MLRALSKKESEENLKRNFAKIRPSTLFDFGFQRYFIAAKKIDRQTWSVVELTEKNKKRIIENKSVEFVNVRKGQMFCLNIRER